MRSGLLRILALGAPLLLLAGCGSSRHEEVRAAMTCPATFAAPGLDAFRVFRPGGGTGTADIRFGARLVDVRSTCHSEEKGVRVDTQVTFQVARNDPQLLHQDLTYFVAVADANQHILKKQIFALRLNFAPRQQQMRIVDQISEHLPLKDLSTGKNYAVIVGLQLSQQQLDLNRGKSSEPPAAPPATGPDLLHPTPAPVPAH